MADWTQIIFSSFTKMSCYQMSCYRNVLLPKSPVTEMSCYRKVLLPKCPITEMSITKVLLTEMAFTEMSWIRAKHCFCAQCTRSGVPMRSSSLSNKGLKLIAGLCNQMCSPANANTIRSDWSCWYPAGLASNLASVSRLYSRLAESVWSLPHLTF